MKAYIFTERDDIPSTGVLPDEGFVVFCGRFDNVQQMPRMTMADHLLVRDAITFQQCWCDVPQSKQALADGLGRIVDNVQYTWLVRWAAERLRREVLETPDE